MGDISVEKEVVYKPAKACVRVPYAVYINLLRAVPKGRLTRYVDIENYIRKQLNVENIEFICDALDTRKIFESYAQGEIPFWRVVSERGFLTDSMNCSRDRQEKLLGEERFTITECGTANRSLRVENYKEYLFDFESELTVDYASLQGLRRLKNSAKPRL